MAITAHPALPKSGANHIAVVRSQQNAADLGVIVWDVVRSQFAFHAASPDYSPNAADSAAILALLNSMTR